MDNAVLQIIDKYNKLKFKYISYSNKLITTASLSRNSIGYKISTIRNIKQSSQNAVKYMNDALNEEIRLFRVKQSAESTTAEVQSNTFDTFLPEQKKSLHIGINYYGLTNQLNGCINDVVNITTFIKTQQGFLDKNITILTDDISNTDPLKIPTKTNILTALTNLLLSGIPGDLLFFTYSGHGTSTLGNIPINYNKTELVPSDYNTLPTYPYELLLIKDSEIKSIIDANLKPGVTLFAIVDACKSGSVFNLVYEYIDSKSKYNTRVNSTESDTKGQVVMISGSTDTETSADAYIDNVWEGAMTWSFIETLTNYISSKNPLTWKTLITSMRSQLRENGYTQNPQLSSGLPLNMDDLTFIK